jgi:hypothetical protein
VSYTSRYQAELGNGLVPKALLCRGRGVGFISVSLLRKEARLKGQWHYRIHLGNEEEMGMDVIPVMEKLKQKRTMFHSEADFQFALAWELQECYPNARVRLEYCPSSFDPPMYIDILVISGNRWYPIELKYKTLRFKGTVQEERYELKNQGAQDTGRYDVLKDVQRLEGLIRSDSEYEYGFVILLTNDQGYWSRTRNENTNDADFRISDTLTKTGQLVWAEKASDGTKAGREDPISLNGSYRLEWSNYSEYDTVAFRGRFKHLVLKIQRQ